MKRPAFVLPVAVAALTSCTTAHDAAVSTFRVLDAPHAYIRRQLGMDENDQATTATTTATETTYATTAASPGSQTYSSQTAPINPSPVQTEHRVTVQEQAREPDPPGENASASPPPMKVAENEHATSTRSSEPKASATPRVAASEKTTGDIPYAKPVPGKPGYVFSPYDKSGGYVDVTGYLPGQKVKDPYTGKIFLVP